MPLSPAVRSAMRRCVNTGLVLLPIAVICYGWGQGVTNPTGAGLPQRGGTSINPVAEPLVVIRGGKVCHALTLAAWLSLAQRCRCPSHTDAWL